MNIVKVVGFVVLAILFSVQGAPVLAAFCQAEAKSFAETGSDLSLRRLKECLGPSSASALANPDWRVASESGTDPCEGTPVVFGPPGTGNPLGDEQIDIYGLMINNQNFKWSDVPAGKKKLLLIPKLMPSSGQQPSIIQWEPLYGGSLKVQQ